MNPWESHAINTLEESLYPVPQELNNLDWKSQLSDNSERLAQHICAFSNTMGGGYMVFGVNNDASLSTINKEDIEEIVNKLGNIARNNLARSIQLEHAVIEFQGHALLFVRVQEQTNKPLYLRGKDIYASYIRSAGRTMKMSIDQVHELTAQSHGYTFEKRKAKCALHADEVFQLLDYKKFFELIDKNIPTDSSLTLQQMEEYGLVEKSAELYNILNLGAILFAHRLSEFPELKGKELIVRRYHGKNNRTLMFERHWDTGYATSFKDIINFVHQNTSIEQIDITREFVSQYPLVAIREFTANMLVHQDFAIKGMPLTIEIFENRLTFTNPGLSLNDINRLIDLPPHSRNEALAQAMFLLDICERRGSGVDRAADAIANMNLPAYKPISGEDYTQIIMFPKKDIADMTRDERIEACYQYACLVYEDREPINNLSIRKRFNLTKKQTVLSSRILSETLTRGLIKFDNPDTSSKRYASYIPYYG